LTWRVRFAATGWMEGPDRAGRIGIVADLVSRMAEPDA
jgi:hypothetical protein